MEANHKKILKAIVLELRHMFEGYYNGSGWHAGDLEQRLNSLGVWRDRNPLPTDELAGISGADREARKVVDAYLKLRDEAGVSREEAVAEFVRETAYTWANRLLALRCMESRELIDEVILQKEVYGGRSLEHNRLAQRNPELCAGDDDGLFAVLDNAFTKQIEHLPLLFDPKAPGVALNPSVAALKRAVSLLSGAEALQGQESATTEMFRAPDVFGWAYQYWNTEERDRVFEKTRVQKGAKIGGADIVPATQLYTEHYMVRFLVQNSLGALWSRMKPETKLIDDWEYLVDDSDRGLVDQKSVDQIALLDPACGSGHFLLEAFDVFYSMYREEGAITDPEIICRSILKHNLFGIDIDERAVQITEAVLWMKAAETLMSLGGSPSVSSHFTNLVATNLRLPKGTDHLKAFISKYPEDSELGPALEVVFSGLKRADELGSLLQIEAPVEDRLQQLREQIERPLRSTGVQTHLYEPTPIQGQLPIGVESYSEWKQRILSRLRSHFQEHAEASDIGEAFFSRSASRSLMLFDLLSRRYDVVLANPPYLGAKKITEELKASLDAQYHAGRNDLVTAFFIRMKQLCSPEGIVAFVSSAGFLWLQLHEDIRGFLSEELPVTIAVHLGYFAFEELGDHVDGLLYVSQGTHKGNSRWFKLPETRNHAEDLKRCVQGEIGSMYELSAGAFDNIPGRPFVYSHAPFLNELYSHSKLLNKIAPAKSGLQTSDIDRFVRNWWEVGEGDRWIKYVKGGDPTSWCEYLTYLVDWQSDGKRIKIEAARRYGSVTRTVKNQDSYFRAGYTFSLSSGHDIAVRKLPSGYIFDVSSPTVFVENHQYEWVFAYLNSSVAAWLINLLNPTMHVTVNDIARLPLPKLSSEDQLMLVELSACASKHTRRLLSHRPDTIHFDFAILFGRSASDVANEIRSDVNQLRAIESKIDDLVATAFEVPSDAPRQRATAPPLLANFGDLEQWRWSSVLLDLFGYRWPATTGSIGSVGPYPSGIGQFASGVPGAPDVIDAVISELERRSEAIAETLKPWIQDEFFRIHTRQFQGRPVIWQIQSSCPSNGRRPALSLFVFARKLDLRSVSDIQSQHLRPLRQRLETEMRSVESVPQQARSDRQQQRLTELMDLIADLRDFDGDLEEVARFGFGPEKMRSVLRQNAIDDTTLCLKSQWLQKLSASMKAGALIGWSAKADETKLHKDLALWITTAMSALRFYCSAVGPLAPKANSLQDDPNSQVLASLICKKADEMVQSALKLACMDWWSLLDEAAFALLRAQIKVTKIELKELKGEDYSKADDPFKRKKEIEVRTRELKENIKLWERDLNEKTATADKLRNEILAWEFPEARSWETWLALQPMYDAISSLDGIRQPPHTVAEWIAQECAYAPDINDGVRVNIAPLQKAGILAADVLPAKEVDKAIADRAEWRADERRWCREGKLPQPGWWSMEKTNGSGQK